MLQNNNTCKYLEEICTKHPCKNAQILYQKEKYQDKNNVEQKDVIFKAKHFKLK
jgi:hypothetical protein